jgi:hypothetical protein
MEKKKEDPNSKVVTVRNFTRLFVCDVTVLTDGTSKNRKWLDAPKPTANSMCSEYCNDMTQRNSD